MAKQLADPQMFALILVEQIYIHIQLVGFEPPTIPQVAKAKTTTSYLLLPLCPRLPLNFTAWMEFFPSATVWQVMLLMTTDKMSWAAEHQQPYCT
jgi:hypothetical protein